MIKIQEPQVLAFLLDHVPLGHGHGHEHDLSHNLSIGDVQPVAEPEKSHRQHMQLSAA